jgi:DNA-binding phage protein
MKLISETDTYAAWFATIMKVTKALGFSLHADVS